MAVVGPEALSGRACGGILRVKVGVVRIRGRVRRLGLEMLCGLLSLLLLLLCELLLCCFLSEYWFDQVERVSFPPARVLECGQREPVLKRPDELVM